jgi:hypothetical protein
MNICDAASSDVIFFFFQKKLKMKVWRARNPVSANPGLKIQSLLLVKATLLAKKTM